MALLRVRVNWTGAAVVGPAVSTFWFDSSGGTSNQAVTAVANFLDSLDTAFTTDITWTTDPVVDAINEATGQLIDSDSVGSETNTGAASNMIAYHRTDTGVWATHSELDEFLAGGNVFVLTEGGGGGASSTPPVVLFTTPSNKMHLETFTSFYYAITVAIGLYFALILFRLFGRRHAR